ncbi:MAG: hypothetical protein COV44_07230 [Deltaproteobacteria bacterium CG11_big_fil_rev_8_21_14_0_20_45_16]|nr:MAG: hypothetical protein COV44_07230 [Deltaproteobacteria bacterium CG11_big_fil_rev_8_21_14_0_20_45_16]
MKIKELLPSFFVVGVRDLRKPDLVKSFLKQYPVPGLALFNAPFESPENIWKDADTGAEIFFEFIRSLEEQIKFFSVDQEGGRVQRLRSPFVRIPSAKKIGEVLEDYDRTDLIFEFYRLAAQQFRVSNISLNFAPVCDLRTENSNDMVIGDRSFSDRLDRVIHLTKIFCEAFESEGIHTTLKHFPGHGSSGIDSHDGIAILQKTKEEIKHTDTRIFKETAGTASCIMTAHIAFPEEPERIFSLDKLYLEEFRKEMPQHLRWLTDDLATMKAVSDRQPWIHGLELGYDHLLLCGNLDQAAKAIEESIRHFESKNFDFQTSMEWELKSRHAQEAFAKNLHLSKFKTWLKEMKVLEAKASDILEQMKVEVS